MSIWVFPSMVVPPKHPKMIICSRKPMVVGSTIFGTPHIPRMYNYTNIIFFFHMVPHEVLLLHGCFLILRVAAPWFLENGLFLCVAPGKMWKLLGWFSSKMIYIDPLETEKGSSFSARFLWDCTLGWGGSSWSSWMAAFNWLGVLKKLLGGSLNGLIHKHNFSCSYRYRSHY